MPIKNVNLEWDLEDPNQVIPGHEAPAKDTGSVHEQPSRSMDGAEITGAKGETQHIEAAPQRTDAV